jgi:hypothetical protein
VDQGNEWTRPVEPDVSARARAGEWSVVLIGYQPVPRDWFPADLSRRTYGDGPIEYSHTLTEQIGGPVQDALGA